MSEPLEQATEKLYYDDLSVARRTSQKIHSVQDHDKNALLAYLIKKYSYKNVIVVTKTKRVADSLSSYLQEQGVKARAMHGNKSAKECMQIMQEYNAKALDVVITTDMILISQEFTQIDHMISYDIALEPKHYYSRLASMHEKGEGIAFVSEEDEPLMFAIEVAMKVEILHEEVEGFESSDIPEKKVKDKVKKPRHKKSKDKKQKKTKEG